MRSHPVTLAPVVAALVVVGSAVGVGPAAAGATGSLRVKIVKVPDTSPRVVVTGPGDYKKSLRKSTTLRRLDPGKYRIKAKDVTRDGGTVSAAVSKTKVKVRQDARRKTKVTYRFHETPDDPGPSPTASPTSSPSPTASPPQPVSGLTATATSTTVTLSWTNPAAVGQVVVRRAQGETPPATAQDGTGVTVSASAATSALDTGLAEGAPYSYAVFTSSGDQVSAAETVSTRTIAPQVLAVGDVGWCGGGTADTAAIVAANPTLDLWGLGDMAYPSGAASDFTNCYDPYYGAFNSRIRAVPGNHEYVSGATPFYNYFGSSSGTPATPWYSFDKGEWHVVMLNSNCANVGGCDSSSPQYAWLQSDLNATSKQCVAAVWHHPRYSSGQHGSDTALDAFWDLLVTKGADVVLSGHDHVYERFRAAGLTSADATTGMRQFVVGTGGAALTAFSTVRDHSQSRIAGSYGVLRLELRSDGYSWEFLPTPVGSAATDSGSDSC